MNEQGVIFNSNGKQLVGIEHLPEPIHQGQTNKGVIIVVGGPQTRVGSHRLFVHLARALAKQGIVVFRFDYSGAGDSEGAVSTFTEIQDDIEAAIHTFEQRHSDITELALWGLCDAASAILLYLNERPQQVKIKQVLLVNPWVRQRQTQAKAYLRSYYMKRFFSKAFWQKLLSGKVKAQSAFTEIQEFHQQSQNSNDIDMQDNFVTQMLQGLNQFSGTCDILLSGNDLTADEFKLLIKSNKHWREAVARATINQQIISRADHTFSQQDKQSQLIKLVCKALVK
ncbi:hydrolase 1, exosortase A system-associated [Colwellia sp. Bg11-28]|uniref:hydrolase 1, exosortase A system-associated n=1 Tax=Colwellia sp. Bg11-28 TaxID=2058305 RepID=UPI000C32F577|nr:hydrolase 1, exosortase A system-associated [Colwellia sp. Bg11-28]PKH88464.1 hydrolase 1, exosortase A system-associated [Colwellia sp. Bg11-28]